MSGNQPDIESKRGVVFAGPRLVVLMGVSGCGKTSVGEALADRLGVPFLDGDDFHPAENVTMMSQGIPLTDENRWPWLDRVARALVGQAERTGIAVAACSALRRIYRERLMTEAGEPIQFVLLDGPRDIIAQRMAARRGHYMPPGLLDSQIDTLEPPEPDERALVLDIGPPVESLAETIRGHLFPESGTKNGKSQ